MKPIAKHIPLEGDAEAVPYVGVDRRRQVTRRAAWRGGRRDTDWTNRPPGAWDRTVHGLGVATSWPIRLFARTFNL
jgi:hypothetical protein